MSNIGFKKEIDVQGKSFLSLINNDIQQTEFEIENLLVFSKKINLILSNDINYLIEHKDEIMSINFSGIDEDFKNRLSALEGFKKYNSLDNPICKNIYDTLLQSIKEISLNSQARIDQLKKELDLLKNLTNNNIDISEILKLCDKYMLDDFSKKCIILYFYRNAIKKVEVKDQEEIDFLETKIEPQKDDSIGKSEFDKLMDIYNKLCIQYEPLLNEAYATKSQMTENELNRFQEYIKCMDDGQENNHEYDESSLKILYIKLIEMHTIIESSKDKLDYLNLEKIHEFAVLIEKYDALIKQINNIKAKLSQKEAKTDDFITPRVCFVHDREGQMFISDSIINEGYQKSLAGIIEKIQTGKFEKSRTIGESIVELKDKKIKQISGRTVYSARNYNVCISFIRLEPSTMLENGGILIINACPLQPNTLALNTLNVIAHNKENIVSIIKKIEQGDAQEIAMQSIILDEVIKSLGGRKVENKTIELSHDKNRQ